MLPANELEAGEYRLELTLADPAGNRIVTERLLFTVIDPGVGGS
jgi:hypothetical protein